MKNISVYVGKGRNCHKLINNQLSIYMSQGLPSDRVQQSTDLTGKVGKLEIEENKNDKQQKLKFNALNVVDDSTLAFINGGGQKNDKVEPAARTYFKMPTQPIVQPQVPQLAIAKQNVVYVKPNSAVRD